MKTYKIEPGRWRIGDSIVEWSWRVRRGREPSIGAYKERSHWHDQDVTRFLAVGLLCVWWTSPARPGCKWPADHRKGWELGPRYWQRWWGSPDGDGKDRVFFNWREALWDWAFGKTVCVHEDGWEGPFPRIHKIAIPLPEGEYEAEAVFEHRVWLRPRWPFHRYRTYTDVRVKDGLPFEGKGENSWDCGEDAICGYSVEGHDLEKAVAEGVRATMRNRAKYGTPTRVKLMQDAQTAGQ